MVQEITGIFFFFFFFFFFWGGVHLMLGPSQCRQRFRVSLATRRPTRDMRRMPFFTDSGSKQTMGGGGLGCRDLRRKKKTF